MMAILWRASNLWRPTVNCDPVERWKARHPVQVRNPMDFILLRSAFLWNAGNPVESLNIRGTHYHVLVATFRVVRLQRGIRFAT